MSKRRKQIFCAASAAATLSDRQIAAVNCTADNKHLLKHRYVLEKKYNNANNQQLQLYSVRIITVCSTYLHQSVPNPGTTLRGLDWIWYFS